MAVSLYFGLPGCGKTTHLVYQAIKAVKSKRYQNVYTNVRIKVPGVTYIDNECIGVFDLSNCLLLIDEATLFADSRAYKSFDKSKLEYFLTHRHYNADICLYTQQWDGVDRKIRVITDRVYYIYKGFFTGKSGNNSTNPTNNSGQTLSNSRNHIPCSPFVVSPFPKMAKDAIYQIDDNNS